MKSIAHICQHVPCAGLQYIVFYILYYYMYHHFVRWSQSVLLSASSIYYNDLFPEIEQYITIHTHTHTHTRHILIYYIYYVVRIHTCYIYMLLLYYVVRNFPDPFSILYDNNISYGGSGDVVV